MSSVLVKLYDKTDTFKKTLSGKYLSTLPRFIEQEQNGHTNLDFTYNVQYDDTTFSHYDIVKVISKSTGDVLYRGVVLGIRRVITGQEEKIEVQAYGLQALVKKTLYYNGSSYTFTKNTDPKDILEEILTNVNSQFGFTPFSRDDTTIIHRGTSVNIDFDYTDSRTAIKKVLELTTHTFRIAGDGTVYFRPKQLGKGYHFDGSNDFIDAGTGHGLDNRDPQTFFCRVKVDDFSANQCLFGYGNATTFILSSCIIKTDGTLQFEIAGTGGARIVSSESLESGKRYDLCFRINTALASGTARGEDDIDMFIDGVKATKNETIIGTATATRTKIIIGVFSETTYSQPFDAQIHDIRVYDSALSDDAIVALGNNSYWDTIPTVWYLCDEGSGTAAKDISGNGNNGTLTNITASTFHISHTNRICDHVLTFKRHISAIEIAEKSDELYNDYHLEYTGGSVQTGNDSDSQTSYGQLTEYISDGAVKDAATATERINAELAKYKEPIEKISVTVNLNYDIETLKVGDVVCVSNINYTIDGKIITKVEFRTDEALIYLEGYDSIENSLQKVL